MELNTTEYERALDVLLLGKMILTGGNGGSFSDGEHFVAELTGRFAGETLAYPAMNMGSNTAELTAFGNDYGYENIFIPYIEAFEQFDPSFVFITTSGESKNIIVAIERIINTYHRPKIVLLTGNSVNKFTTGFPEVNVLRVPHSNTQKIQEAHIVMLHRLAEDLNKFHKKENDKKRKS